MNSSSCLFRDAFLPALLLKGLTPKNVKWRVRIIFLSFLVFAAASLEASNPPTFENDVRPIFKANCFHCHGEEKELKE